MRDGWKETLTALAQGGVPTFVFSSGYGDVIAQVTYVYMMCTNIYAYVCIYMLIYLHM
jgi:hypothetical protein